MKKTHFLIALNLILFFVSKGQNDTLVSSDLRPADFEYLSAPDSLGNRTPLKMPNLSRRAGNQKLPYPILFIHGLNSNSSEAWNTTTDFMDDIYDFTYGGRFDFCLNNDGYYNLANTNVYPTAGADVRLFNGSQIVGDYYYVNFATGINGSFNPPYLDPINVLSNQSAVVKQGLALSIAIKNVLQITGRDKVILMGHSMGGLAARQYLQNSNLWLPDGQHHVAKLVTAGTPHGGSNASASILNTWFKNIDNQSEAVRDLREDYFYSGSPGVFLYGGVESNAVMDDMLAYDFVNVDVNCNGQTGNNVLGLNNKSISRNLDFACIVGTANPLNGGDYVVDDENANINYYYSGLTSNVFKVSSSHTNLPTLNNTNMQGLDEPNEYNISYDIKLNTEYTGFITTQPVGGYQYDYDDFRFVVNTNSTVNVKVENISLANLRVQILDASYSRVGNLKVSNGSSIINFLESLNAGTYYLEIYGEPTTNSYLYPYKFIISTNNCNPPTSNFTASSNSNTVSFTNTSTNATSYTWYFGNGNTSTNTNPTYTYLSSGTYTVTLTATNSCGSTSTTKSINVTQGCAYFLSHTTSSVSHNAGNHYIDLTTSQNCSWSLSEPCNWVVFYSNGGTGNYTLSYNVTENTSTVARVCTVDIMDTPFYITQLGKPCIQPTAMFSVSGTAGFQPFSVDFTDASTDNPTEWFWSFQGGTPSTSYDQNPNGIVFENCGLFNVSLVAVNECGNDKKTIDGFVNVLCTSVSELNESRFFTISPNPGNGFFNVDVELKDMGLYQLNVLNSVGQNVFLGELNSGRNQIDLSHLSSGMYQIALKSNATFFVDKFIIQK